MLGDCADLLGIGLEFAWTLLGICLRIAWFSFGLVCPCLEFAWNLIGTRLEFEWSLPGIYLLGMCWLGGLKGHAVNRDHMYRVQAPTPTISPLQKREPEIAKDRHPPTTHHPPSAHQLPPTAR